MHSHRAARAPEGRGTEETDPHNTNTERWQPARLASPEAPRAPFLLPVGRVRRPWPGIGAPRQWRAAYHRRMDDIVRQAMAKWPNVPHCHDWLGLDARGRWFMRDDRVQAAGPFPQVKGSLLTHEKLVAFIHRNYEHDAEGQWYFQNGPQRVYVELEATPFIWRVAPDGSVTSHTGQPAVPRSACLDEEGRLYLDTDLGFGLVHSLDMEHAASQVEAGHWQPEEVRAADLPARFGFVRSPAARRKAQAAA